MIKSITLSSPPKVLGGRRLKTLFRVLYILTLLLIAITGYGQKFTESVGVVSADRPIAGHAFDNVRFSFSGTGTVSGGTFNNSFPATGANIHLNGLENFRIAGINTTFLSGISVSLKLQKNTSSGNGSDLVIEASTDGGSTWTTLSLNASLVNGNSWQSRTLTGLGALSPTANLMLRFTNGNNRKYRLDDIALSGTGRPSINLMQQANVIANGSGEHNFGNVPVGSSSSAVMFTIQNKGAASLNLTGTPKIQLSGADAAQFSINQATTAATLPEDVATSLAHPSTTYEIVFSPTSLGFKTATVTIASNDPATPAFSYTVKGGNEPVTITGFTPSCGREGDEVTITGSGFLGVSTVTFAGGAQAQIQSKTATEIIVLVPAGAGTGPIVLQSSDGGIAQTEEDFMIAGPQPVYEYLSVQCGAEGDEITITGTNLLEIIELTFGGGELGAIISQTATEIKTVVPAGAANGVITLFTGCGEEVYTDEFFIGNSTPVITAISPLSGKVGDQVIITGTGLENILDVTFGGGELATIVSKSATEIIVTVPEGATNGLVWVFSACDESASEDEFLVISPTVTVTGTLNPFGAQAGTFSAPQSYQVSGTNIANNITVTAPAQFQVSLSSGSGYGSSVSLPALSGTVANTTVYARYAPTASGSHSGDISHATTGGASQLLAVSGSTNLPMIEIAGTYATVANQEIFIPTSGQQFSVSGSNLTDIVTITAPQHYEVSATGAGSGFTSAITIPQSGGSVVPTSFWIRYNPASLLGHPGNVVASSTGAANYNVPVNGNAVTVEPTEPSYIVADNPTTGSIDLTLVGLGNGQKRIIVARQGSGVNANPADGTTYTPSATFGLGSQTGPGNYVVYVGTGTQVTVTGLGGGTTYYFAVYDFNDEGLAGAENYLSEGNIAYATTITATYVWNTPAGNWDEAASWSPLRTTPSPTDILVFDGAVQASPVVTINFNATKVIGQLKFVNNTTTRINVESTATLDLEAGAGQTGDDLLVEEGAALRIVGTASTNKLILNVKAGQTALVRGSITLEGTGLATHRIRPEQAGAIIFENGSTFTAGAAFSGNAFGLTNGVVFRTGSTYVHKSSEAVANVFGPPAPNTPVLSFQTGSTYRHESTTAPDLNGRTYGNFVLNHASFNQANLTGSYNLTVEHLTVLAGTAMGINLTGTVTIKGDIAVNAGALNFTPASANVIHLNGTGDQTISGSGTLTFGSNAAVQLGTAAVVRLEKNMAVNGSLSVGNALHMKANVISGTGTFAMDANTTLGIGHAGGISLAGASGNIQMAGQRTYSSTGNYLYNGTVAQLTGDGLPSEANSLTINNAADVTANGSGTLVKVALALQSGRFTTSASNSLTVAQTGSISGGSSTAFVNGPLAQVLVNSVSDRRFPVGKGSEYLPVTLSVSHTDGLPNTYTAEQFNAGPSARTMTGELKRVSASRHFNISKTGSSVISAASVTIGYNNDLNEATASNLRIGKSNGSEWVSIGGSGSAPGTGAGTITSNGFTSFSDFVLASIEDEPAPLPVSLLTFTGAYANGQVNLHWVTASEKNNRHFEVERSGNGLTFQKISTVAGAGTTTEKRNYASVDRNPLSGTSYYRLKQVDLNGTFVYSKVIAIRNNNQPTEAKVYPNPTSDILKVDLGSQATKVKVMIVNMVGQVVLSQEITGLESQQHFSLDVSRLSKGTYQLLVQTAEFKTTHKFIKTDR